MRAGLGELALMKGRSWLGRDEDKDLEDFKFLLRKMDEAGERFGDLLLLPEDVESLTKSGKAACDEALLQKILYKG